MPENTKSSLAMLLQIVSFFVKEKELNKNLIQNLIFHAILKISNLIIFNIMQLFNCF